MKKIFKLTSIVFLIPAIILFSCKNEESPLTNLTGSQIIADHTIVDRFDDIPAEYIARVKKMWLVVAGESHSEGYRTGLSLLESSYPAYAVSVINSGTPEPYVTTNLRVSRGTWGDVNNETGWIYGYGEEDWFTSEQAISRTKAGITYENTNNFIITAFGRSTTFKKAPPKKENYLVVCRNFANIFSSQA